MVNKKAHTCPVSFACEANKYGIPEDKCKVTYPISTKGANATAKVEKVAAPSGSSSQKTNVKLQRSLRGYIKMTLCNQASN